MALTRYEGLAAALVLLPLLCLRVRWRTVVVVAALTGLFYAPWVVLLTRVYGAPWKTPYVTRDIQQRGFGSTPAEHARSFQALLENAGWLKPWRIPVEHVERSAAGEYPRREVLSRILSSPTWWLSLLAYLGMLGAVRMSWRNALPILLPFAAAALLITWYITFHGRYGLSSVAVTSFWSALGAGVAWQWVQRVVRPAAPRAVGLAILAVGLGWLLRTEGPARYAGSLNRLWEHQGTGYATYQALRFVGERPGTVVVSGASTMAQYVLGHYPARARRGIFLHPDFKDASDQRLWDLLVERKPAWIIPDGSERVARLVARLAADGRVRETVEFSSPLYREGKEVEVVRVLGLTWEGTEKP